MGIGDGKKVLHRIVDVSMVDVYEMSKGVAKERGMDKATIVGDVSNIAYAFSKAASIVVSMSNHFVKWANAGFILIPVCDGDVRPICKQATNKRKAESDKKRIKAYQLRKAIRQAKQRLIEESLNLFDRQSLEKEINSLERQCKTYDTQSRSTIPKNLAEELQRELFDIGAHSSHPLTGGTVGTVAVAQFQADSYMAHQIIDNKASMVMSRDADLPILCGDDCIEIKEFTGKKFEIVCTSKDTLERAMTYLPKETNAKLIDAECPLFDGVKSPRLRALMMVILGCDVYGPGMKGVKAKKLVPLIESFKATSEEDLYQKLFCKFKTTNKLSDIVINTYIDALLYEPTNAMPNNIDEENPAKTYLFGPPTNLPEYLKEFAVDEEFKANSIFPGPEIATCKGVGGSTHPFLSSDGVKKCIKCEHDVCQYCQEDIIKETYCLSCYATESVVPQSGGVGSKSIAQMRKELVDDNFDGAKDLASDEVEDVYEMMIHLRNIRTGHQTNVEYPLYATSEMDGEVATEWEDLIEIDFKDGGAFLAEPDLGVKNIPGVLELFASLVRFEEGKKTEWIKDPAIYDALPSLFIKFASGSRVDSGYRLLMRCVRHAFDSRAPSLEEQTAMLVLHQGDVGIHLNADIPASMKKKVYQTGTVATAKDILCCKCTCQCGSQNDQRIVCVHNFPLLFLLTLLLFEALAENILLELAACLSAGVWDKSVWSEGDIVQMKKSIITLAEAAGEPVGTHSIEDDIDDLLEKFVVGTQRRKAWKQRIKTPPNPSELGPAHTFKFRSTAKEASAAVKRCSDIEEQILQEPRDHTVADVPQFVTFTPDYHRIWCLMEAADCENVLEMGTAGFELLSMRSDRQMQSMDKLERTSIFKQMVKDWDELKRLAKKRSIRNIASKIDNLPITSTQEQHLTPSPTKKHKSTASVTPSPPKPLRRQGMQLPLRKPKKKPSHRCAKCTNNNVNSPNVKFHLIPSYPTESTAKSKKREAAIKRAGTILLRQETMDRVGLGRYNEKKKYVCEEHMFEVVTKWKLVKYEGESFVHRYQLTVPCAEGAKSSASPSNKVSKGTGYDRAVRRLMAEASDLEVAPSLHNQAEEWKLLLKQLEEEREHMTSPTDSAKNLEEQNLVLAAMLELERANTVHATKAVQQMAEETCHNNDVPINDSVRHEAGMSSSSNGNASSVKTPKRNFFHSDPIKPNTGLKKFAVDSDPSIYLGMPDDEVKRRTGFSSEMALLAYIFIVCNGDINLIKKRATSLTWYEEWFLHFEYIWGKSLTRLEDLSKTFGVAKRYIDDIITAKYDIEFRALLSWPLFASYEEDDTMRSRKDRWKNKYQGMRPVMWDMTNLTAYGFSDADLQRLTFNQYYGENCLKGGIFTQLCGWQGVYDLWMGAVSDSDYNRRAGYLQEQEAFQNNDLVQGRVLPFLNIYDKGYRAKMAAWKNGKQQVLQPDWAESDRHFNRNQTLGSASVASDRGGNERSVNVSKRAGYVSRGLVPNQCPIRFNKAWRTWAFQSNFMFKPVL